MRVLRNTLSDVVGGWTYTVPETGFEIKAQWTYAILIEKVKGHYSVNGLDLPVDIELLVQSQISSRVPLRMTKEIHHG